MCEGAAGTLIGKARRDTYLEMWHMATLFDPAELGVGERADEGRHIVLRREYAILPPP